MSSTPRPLRHSTPGALKSPPPFTHLSEVHHLSLTISRELTWSPVTSPHLLGSPHLFDAQGPATLPFSQYLLTDLESPPSRQFPNTQHHLTLPWISADSSTLTGSPPCLVYQLEPHPLPLTHSEPLKFPPRHSSATSSFFLRRFDTFSHSPGSPQPRSHRPGIPTPILRPAASTNFSFSLELFCCPPEPRHLRLIRP